MISSSFKYIYIYIYVNIAYMARIFLEYTKQAMTYLLQAKARLYEH